MSCLGRAFGEEEWFNRHGPRAEDVIDRRIDARVRIAGGGVKSIVEGCMGEKIEGTAMSAFLSA